MRKSARSVKTRRVALLAVMLALVVVLSFLPLNLGAAVLALTILPVLVVALTQDIVTSAAAGLLMGLTSCLMAYTVNAGTLTAPMFQNPLVSVLPRVFVPLVVFGARTGLSAAVSALSRRRSLSARAEKTCLAAVDYVSAALGVVTNTALVLGMIWLVYGGTQVGNAYVSPEFVMGMVSLNFVIEVIVFPLLSPPIAYAVRRQGCAYLTARQRAEQSSADACESDNIAPTPADDQTALPSDGDGMYDGQSSAPDASPQNDSHADAPSGDPSAVPDDLPRTPLPRGTDSNPDNSAGDDR